MDQDIDDLVKTTTRGSIILLIGQVSSTLILAAGMLLVARFLGPSKYGLFNKSQSVIGIAILLMNLGVNQALVRYIAKYRHEGKDDYIRVFMEVGSLLTVGASVLMTIIVYLSSGFIANEIFNEPEQELYIQYLSISLIGHALSTLAQGITVGFERMELRSLITISYSFIKSLISPILVYIGLGTLGAIIGHTSPILLSGLVGSIFVIMIYRNQRKEPRAISYFKVTKMILTFGFPLYLSTLMTGLLPQLFTTFLGIWETNEKIGNYSVATNFSVLLSFISIPISTTIFPLFSKLEKNQKELEFLYRNAIKYSTLFGYPIIFTIIALADQIIMVLFRPNYFYAANYLRIYIFAFILLGFGSAVNSVLLSGQERNDITLKSTLGKFLVALTLSYYLIQKYGVIGLLYTFFISNLVNDLINLFFINRIFSFRINASFLLKMMLISLVSCLSVYYVFTIISVHPWIELFSGGMLSVLIYFIGVLLLKVLTEQDYLYLWRISDNFGPFSPIIRCVIDFLIRFS